MGKVIERVKITNLLDPTRSIEIDAVIDTASYRRGSVGNIGPRSRSEDADSYA